MSCLWQGSCLCWCPSPDGGPAGQNLVSSADDGTTRVWRWDGAELVPVGQHNLHCEGRSRVTGASWSRPDPTLVVTADEVGSLGVWDLLANSVKAVNFGKHSIFTGG